ncbi:tetratricopeptide repeat protein [Prevotella dentasini]|uniref:tetratricopeptide repeat protein n=1 Tax=Prevotella dentasini TaxID=589537 RepID=UPI00278C5523|nr:tetratricopeptide repeat protein [Prevotella dentasini]
MADGQAGGFLDADELTDIAEYYRAIGKNEEADEVAEYTLSIFPGATGPLAFKARLALLIEDNPKKADELAEQIADKTDLDYFYLKAEILLATYRAEEANDFLEETFSNAVDEDDREDYILDAALLFADYNEIDYAEHWTRRSTLTDDNDYKELQGRILKGHGKYAESEKIFNELLDANPYAGPYWNQLAQNQFLRNNIQASIDSSEFAIAINPNDDEALLNKANGLFSLGNYDEALKYYMRYKEISPSSDTSLIDVTIGHLYLLKNDIAKALQYYQESVRKSKDMEATFIHIAISVFDNGYVEFAYRLFSAYLSSMDEQWTFGYAYLARCCYELDKEAEYELWLKIAVGRNPEECAEVLSDLYPEGTMPEDYPGIPVIFPSQREQPGTPFPGEDSLA